MTIDIGIIGCGRAGIDLHLPALNRVEGARVVALADSDPARLQAARERCGVDAGFTRHGELLAGATVEAVLVATPADSHATVVRDCLNQGKHLLVEKPLAVDPEEGRALVEAAAEAGVRAAVGHNLRCHRLVREARRLLAAGAIGEVEAAFSIWSTDIALRAELPEWRKRRATQGGVVHEVAIHHFDLWRYLLDVELEQVAVVSKPGERDDDSTAISCRYSGGLPITMMVSQTTAVQHVIEIWGREGRLRIDLYRFDGLEVVGTAISPGDLGARAKGLLRTMRELPGGLATSRRGGDFLDSYRVEWEQLLTAIRTDGPVHCDFEDGLAAVAAAHAAARSAETRELVSL